MHRLDPDYLLKALGTVNCLLIDAKAVGTTLNALAPVKPKQPRHDK